jgi:hypothetical protein
MKIELTCKSCGENRFSFPEGNDDDSPVNCVECGHALGTLGSLKVLIERAVMDSINQRQSPPPQ